MRKTYLLLSVLFVFTLGSFNLNAQDKQMEEFNYVSPNPEAKYANPGSSIAFRHGDEIKLSSIKNNTIQVVGSLSGELAGKLKLSKDNRTIIFKSNFPFQYNETITVEVLEGIQTNSGIEIKPFSYSFSTMKEDNTQLKENFINWSNDEYKKLFKDNIGSVENTNADPSYSFKLSDDLPVFDITTFNNPGPGYIFITPHNPLHPMLLPSYSLILDHYGTPVYTKLNSSHSLDFKIQETGDLSQFLVTGAAGLGIGYGIHVTYDSQMNPLDTFQMGNDYTAEMHDFLLFNDGSSLLFTYDPQIVDMSQIVEGGDPAATVIGAVVQELDADKNVVFEWNSFDYMPITNATPDIDLTGVFIDYCHINAIERDDDGNILVSFRNTDEIMKINRETGDIMWRLNAFNDDLNDFTFINDTIKFSHQHDIRRQENGNITIFDNGNLHWGPYSRIIDYELDEVNMTAELVNVFPPEPGPGHHFGFATGGAHRQENGNTMVGWGIKIPFTSTALIYGEITANGNTTYAVQASDTITTYRAHKYIWETDLFTLSKDTIDWGEFSGYTPEPYIVQVTNNSAEAITISEATNRTTEFFVSSQFPINIESGATENITINYFPSISGNFEDALTIMCQKDENEMIGKQVVLKGHTGDDVAPTVSFNPENLTEDINRMPTLKMTFNEKIYKTGGDMITDEDLQDILFLNPLGDPTPFKAWISWYDNKKTEITIQPFDYLEANTLYYWGVNANTVEDWAGNGIIEEVYSTFATGEEMGVDDILVNDFARIYPNPTQGYLNLEFTNNQNKSVVIYNLTGKEIARAENLNRKTYTFDISDQPEGIYIVRVLNQITNSSVELKVIKK